MVKEHQNINIYKITELAKQASLLEINTEPKIGNIGPGKAKLNTTYQDFIVSVDRISKEIQNYLMFLDTKLKNTHDLETLDYTSIEVGRFYYSASKAMMDSQRGGNTLLGHILLFGPLLAGMFVVIKYQTATLDNLMKITKKIIDNTTAQDSIDLYKAIRYANPGGLGTKTYLDVNSDESLEEIKKNNITLKDILKISENQDFLSFDIGNNYPFTYRFSYPHLSTWVQQYPMGQAILLLFISILSEIPDTLIVRKYGMEKALYVREKAKDIFNSKTFSEEFYEKIKKLDEELSDPNCYINPGTTADLTASGILVHLFIETFGLSVPSE
jgi:triphosphoribosyl-dephospho-CoA synthase